MDISTWQNALAETSAQFVASVAALLPRLVVAIFLLGVGWLAARITRAVVARLTGVGLRRLSSSPVIGTSLARPVLQEGLTRLVSAVAFWTVFLFSAAAAIERLSLQVATDLVSQLAYYLPSILIGLLIIVAGYLAGGAASVAITRAADSAGIPHGALLGRVARLLLILLGLVIGADQLGIESTLLTVIVTTLFGVAVGAIGLAFGLGSRQAVSNLISSHYVRKLYEVGQTITVGDIRGRIIEFNQTGVLVDSPGGRVLIPASRFSQEPSTLIPEGDV
jgi:small-conductance mechanosensitive channel